MYIDDVNKLDSISFNERELYEELLAIQSEFEQSNTVNKVRARAKQLGITKQFDNNWTAAVKEFSRVKKQELSKSGGVYATNITDFPDRDIEQQFSCGSWIADESGIRIQTDKGNELIVCPHPIYPVRVLRNSETGKYKVELEFTVRGTTRNIFVDKETLANPTKILKLANDSVQITSLTSQYLVKYLADLEALNPEIVKEYTSTSRLGWIVYRDHDNKMKRKFLPYEQEVVFDNELSMKTLFDSITTFGEEKEWYDLLRRERSRRKPELNVNLAASFASVLVEPCGALPFIVSLWGGTGIGKSVILKICTSVWADPGEGKYITDAKATSTAMEIRLNILNSLPMTLDDMAQVKNQYDEDFSELIYRWCAGKGRDRSNKELGLNKLTSWRNCTLTNGERSLVDESTQGGAVNRVIDIEASGEEIYNGKTGNKVVNCIEKNYGFAGKGFIDAINEIGFDKLNDLYLEQYNRIKDNAAEKGVEKEDKQVVPMALILTADIIAEKHLFKDGVLLDIDTCVDYLKNKGDVSEHDRAYEYLVNELSVNARHFADNDGEEVEGNIEQWGFWKDSDHVVINGNVFDEILKGAGFQSRAFLSWCKKHDLIEIDNRGTAKKLVKHKGQTFRAVVLDVTYKQDAEEVETTPEKPENDGFMHLPDGIQEELPFK